MALSATRRPLSPQVIQIQPSWYLVNESELTRNTGQPSKWTHQEYPIELAKDGIAGLYLKTPIQHPMAPAVCSILHANPIFSCSDVNFFACGATLGELFRYAQKPECHSAFRIRFDQIGDTVFFTRLSPSSEKARRDADRYGRSYTSFNTTSEVRVNSIGSHKRIIGYNLGGLKMVLQFEADAYIEDKLPFRDDGVAAKNLSSYLNLDSKTNTNVIPSKKASTIEIQTIPQSALMRIETRSNRGLDGRKVVGSQLHRLWLRQVTSFALAWHFDGHFHPEDIKELDVSQSDFAEFERDNQETIRKLVSFLEKLQAKLKATSSGKMVVSCEKGGTLETLEIAPDSAAILPKHLEARWRIGASKANPIIKTQAQTTKTFSGSTRTHRQQTCWSDEEDLIDLRSDTTEPCANDRAGNAPAFHELRIDHPSPKPERRLKISTNPPVKSPKQPAADLIVLCPESNAPALIAPGSRAVISHTQADNATTALNAASVSNTATDNNAAEKNSAIDVLQINSQAESFSNTPATLTGPCMKDFPQYNWLAPACIYGAAYTMAVFGLATGCIVVLAICAAIYAGYTLCTKINSLPPVQVEYSSAEAQIDSKLKPAPSTPNPQTGRVQIMPRPVTPDTERFCSSLPGKPVEIELIETRLPETDAVRTHTAPSMPLPSNELAYKWYCKNNE